MTCRDIMIQAGMELGMSRKEAEWKAKWSAALFPESMDLFADSAITPGSERELIDDIKEIYREIQAHPQHARDFLRAQVAEQAKNN